MGELKERTMFQDTASSQEESGLPEQDPSKERSQKNEQDPAGAEPVADAELSGSLPGVSSTHGDLAMFDHYESLADILQATNHMYLKLPSGSQVQGHFAFEYRYDGTPELTYSHNTSYHFVLEKSEVDALGLRHGDPVDVALTIKGNTRSTNEEGFEYINRQTFAVSIDAMKAPLTNPTIEDIAALAPDTGFVVEGEVVNLDPFAVATDAGHELVFTNASVPLFRRGVLEYEQGSPAGIGDRLRFNAARTRDERDHNPPRDAGEPSLHIPFNYQTLELLEASEARILDYAQARVDRKAERDTIQQHTRKQEYVEARNAIAATLQKPLNSKDREQLQKVVEKLPAEERPIHPDGASYLLSQKAAYRLESASKEVSVNLMTLNQKEFEALYDQVAAGLQHGKDRFVSIENLYDIVREIEGDTQASTAPLAKHLQSMIAAYEDEGSAFITVGSTASRLAYIGTPEAGRALFDGIQRMYDQGFFDDPTQEQREMAFAIVQHTASAVAQNKVDAHLLLENADLLDSMMASLFPTDGYGHGQGSLADHIQSIRKQATAIRSGYDIAQAEQRDSDPAA